MSDQREADVELLAQVLECTTLKKSIRRAFEEMRGQLCDGTYHELTARRRLWAEQVLGEHAPQYENLWSSGKVPPGKPVPTPEVLRKLPMKPPGRAAS